MKLVIASRKSDLARIQSYTVADALQKANPGLQVEFHFHESLGDKNLNDPLWKMPDKGVFTADLTEGLLRGDWDVVVHSWKDLPVETHLNTAVIATLKREDQRDLLLIPKQRLAAIQDRLAAERELHVLSSSPRREFNLTPFFKDYWPGSLARVRFSSVRGNVPTRIRKLLAGEGDALIVAKAALDRLLETHREEFQSMQAELKNALSVCEWMILPLSLNPTAAAQGALAIEALKNRTDLERLFATIHSSSDFANVNTEREILKERGGGCHQKVGISVQEHREGKILTVVGENVSKRSFTSLTPRNPLASAEGSLKTLSGSAIKWFNREMIPTDPPEYANIYVSHPDALPENWSPADFSNRLFWTAGLQTWKKLAVRGFWVNGTDDSLGESEPQVDHLSGEERAWVKLSHEGGSDEAMFLLPTYRLKPCLIDVQKITNHSVYFWKSSSQFERALEIEPALRLAKHCCGLGRTALEIRKRLPDAQVEVFLDENDWRQYYGLS